MMYIKQKWLHRAILLSKPELIMTKLLAVLSQLVLVLALAYLP
jgi:hypothetical protein